MVLIILTINLYDRTLFQRTLKMYKKNWLVYSKRCLVFSKLKIS